MSIDSLSTVSPMAVYVAQCRAESARRVAAGGMPLIRQQHGSVLFASTADPVLVQSTATGIAVRDSGGTIGVSGLSARLLESPIVCLDRAATAHAHRALSRHSDQATVARFHLATRFPISWTVTTLTDALSRRYWMPAGHDPESIAAWLTVTGASTMADLVSLCHGDDAWLGEWSRLVERERNAMRWVKGLYVSAANSVYPTMQDMSSHAAFLDAVDPIGRQEANVRGTSITLTAVPGLANGRYVASLPCRLKTGDYAYLIDDDRQFEVTVEHMATDAANRLVVTVRDYRRYNRHLPQAGILVAKPYSGRAPKSSEWAKDPAWATLPPVTQRRPPVPLDVSVSGQAAAS